MLEARFLFSIFGKCFHGKMETCINYDKGGNGLIPTTGAPLGDYFLGIFFEIFKKFSKIIIIIIFSKYYFIKVYV